MNDADNKKREKLIKDAEKKILSYMDKIRADSIAPLYEDELREAVQSEVYGRRQSDNWNHTGRPYDRRFDKGLLGGVYVEYDKHEGYIYGTTARPSMSVAKGWSVWGNRRGAEEDFFTMLNEGHSGFLWTYADVIEEFENRVNDIQDEVENIMYEEFVSNYRDKIIDELTTKAKE